MAQSSSKCHCSVLCCSSNKQMQPYLSLHDCPTDPVLRAHLVIMIRRDEGPSFKILRMSMYVCSLHFNQDLLNSEMLKTCYKGGCSVSVCLERQGMNTQTAVGVWEGWWLGVDVRAGSQEDVTSAEDGEAAGPCPDQDYASPPSPGKFKCISQCLKSKLKHLVIESNDLTKLVKSCYVLIKLGTIM